MKNAITQSQSDKSQSPSDLQALIHQLASVLDDATDELEVWQLGSPHDHSTQAIIQRARAALAAVSGEEARPADPLPGITCFDSYEIAPVREEDGSCEICAPSEAHFWTLYGHIPGEGVQAIADMQSRKDCEELLYRITGSVEYLYNGLSEQAAITG
jgi:hypothetical protein